jgi:hypothetical protein
MLTVTGPPPLVEGVVRVELVPYWNQALPREPCGLTVPFRVAALLLLMDVAASVVAIDYNVLKLRMAP